MNDLNEDEINMIKIGLELYRDYKKEIEHKEILSMVENKLFLIVDSPCRKLQKLSRDLNSISEKLNINVKYE
jgi:hypothetical protein|tara:strand:+ start:363 stop:578 length:216 start_codon:yes stop_codon:yes gene_type:complete